MNCRNWFLNFSLPVPLAFFLSTAAILLACTSNENAGQTQNDPALQNTCSELLCQYFPSSMHAFIWRNWESVSLDRMAKVLDTAPEKVRQAGRSMGLPPHREPRSGI